MADEIAQVCQLEVDGIKMICTASVKAAQFIMEAFKAVVKHAENAVIGKSGSKRLNSIFKMSEGGPPQVVYVDETKLKEFQEVCKKNGVHYHLLEDLNPDDGKVPVCVPFQEVGVFSAIIKKMLKNDIEKEEKELNDNEKMIAERQEKLLTATPEEREELLKEIDALETANNEMKDSLNRKKEEVEKENIAVSFSDYLLSGKGTEFEKDPDKAMTELEKGVPLTKASAARECFQVVRNPELAPQTGFTFYLPEIGAVVTREFAKDENTNTIYSKYSFKDSNGVINDSFTDRGVSKKQWDEEILPKFFNATGILEDTKCLAFTNQDHLKKYYELHNKIKPKSEAEFEKRKAEGKENFSSADVEKEVNQAVSNELKGTTSAEHNQFVSVELPKEAVIQKDGYIVVQLDEDRSLLFSHALEGKSSDDKISFKFDKNKMATLHNEKFNSNNLVNAKSIVDEVNKCFGEQVVEGIKEMVNAKGK